MGGNILEDLLRTVFFAIDNVVYSIIPIIYKLFIYLSEINLFSTNSELGALVNRVYVFLGIFMLFKISFSLLQYLIDPNSFSDKSKGFGKLVTNALVTMVLLVSVPFIFEFAVDWQEKIVKSNAIGRLMLGESTGEIVQNTTTDKETGKEIVSSLNTDTVSEMATDVQFLMFGAFFSVNPDAIGECKNTNIFGTVAMASNKKCLEKMQEEFESSNNDMAAAGVTLQDFFKTAEGDNVSSSHRKFSNFDKLLWWKVDGEYAIDYLPIVSTVAGIYVVFLLITFSIDIAVRAIKLCFLQMIAPIAIVSYIDPKESISNGKLHNWIKECATTYFSLFLRLAIIFLVMVLISAIASGVLAEGGFISKQINDNEYNIWIYLFLIIGAFMFAKKVPQMIESIFGIKSSGELNLNPFKNAGMAGLTGVAVGAGVGGIASGIASASVAHGNGDSAIKALGSGFLKGTIGGGLQGRKWDGKGAASLLRTPLDVSGELARYQDAKHGTSFHSRAAAMGAQLIGAVQPAEMMKKRIENADRFNKLHENVAKGISSKVGKMGAGKFNSYNKDTKRFSDAAEMAAYNTIEGYNQLNKLYENAKVRGDYDMVTAIENGTYQGQFVGANGQVLDFAQTSILAQKDAAEEALYSMMNGGHLQNDTDLETIQTNIDAMQRIYSENRNTTEFANVGDNAFATVDSMNKANKQVKSAKNTIEQSGRYEDATQSKEAVHANTMYKHFTGRK